MGVKMNSALAGMPQFQARGTAILRRAHDQYAHATLVGAPEAEKVEEIGKLLLTSYMVIIDTPPTVALRIENRLDGGNISGVSFILPS